MPACMSSRDMSDSASSEAHEETGKTPDAVTAKLYEGPALDEGKTGVASWSLYAGFSSEGGGLLAYGTNRDGLIASVMVLDYGTGTLGVYENRSRDDGAPLQPAPGDLLDTYGAELHGLLSAFASQSDVATVAPQALRGYQLEACLGSVLAPATLAAASVVGFFLILDSMPIALTATAGTIIASGGIAGGIQQVMDTGTATAAGVWSFVQDTGAGMLANAKTCAVGAPGSVQ